MSSPATGTDPAVLVTRDETDPSVAVVTLNRPAKYNALTVELKEALLAAAVEVAADETVRAVVLTGAGKAFCVGQDLGEHAAALEVDPVDALGTVRRHYNPLIRALNEAPKPVIAAINGPCVGAGLGIALAADLRIAAEGLKFSTAFTGIGLSTDSGLAASLARRRRLPGDRTGAAERAVHRRGRPQLGPGARRRPGR